MGKLTNFGEYIQNELRHYRSNYCPEWLQQESNLFYWLDIKYRLFVVNCAVNKTVSEKAWDSLSSFAKHKVNQYDKLQPILSTARDKAVETMDSMHNDLLVKDDLWKNDQHCLSDKGIERWKKMCGTIRES